MNTINYHNITFFTSVSNISQLPEDVNAEVAFVGYSNVGKSSTLNALVGQKQMARTSKTPGRTQCINFFRIDEKRYLVDLPGYGYAKVPQTMKENWHRLLDTYLRERKSLCGLVLLMDIRHPLKDFEREILGWVKRAGVPVHVLLTKADKLSRGAQMAILQKVRAAITLLNSGVTISVFSAKANMGVLELKSRIEAWLAPLAS